MSNRTFLQASARLEIPRNGSKGIKILCAADYILPYFWSTLFDKSSVIVGEFESEDEGELLEVPCLSARMSEAEVRSRQRWKKFGVGLGTAHEKLYETWLAFVVKHAKQYVQCNTAELCMMYDSTEKFLEYVNVCFQRAPVKKGRGRGGEAVPQAQISDYCGYRWNLKVPWDKQAKTS